MRSLSTTNGSSPYDRVFFENHRAGSSESARIVLGHLFEQFRPQSIVDVGCGEGHWLAAASRLGVPRVLGLDGDYVDRSRLAIPVECFHAADLAKPLDIGTRFDLAISMEVAEHLDASAAGGFIGELVKLSPAVLFSAAIPGQGGTDHRNEQWPSYWAALFAAHGFACFDILRPKIWHDERVEVWYRQNSLLFLKDGHPLREAPALRYAIQSVPIDAMHPAVWAVASHRLVERVEAAERPTLRMAARRFAGAVLRGLRNGRNS